MTTLQRREGKDHGGRLWQKAPLGGPLLTCEQCGTDEVFLKWLPGRGWLCVLCRAPKPAAGGCAKMIEDDLAIVAMVLSVVSVVCGLIALAIWWVR